MTDEGTTQDNFTRSAPLVELQSVSLDWVDGTKLVHDPTTPTIILVFKITVGYTNLDTRQM